MSEKKSDVIHVDTAKTLTAIEKMARTSERLAKFGISPIVPPHIAQSEVKNRPIGQRCSMCTP